MIFTVIKNPRYLFKRPFTVWYKTVTWFILVFILFFVTDTSSVFDAFVGALGWLVLFLCFKCAYLLILIMLGMYNSRVELCEKEKFELNELKEKDKHRSEDFHKTKEEEAKLKALQEQKEYEEKQQLKVELEKAKVQRESRINFLNEKVNNGTITDEELDELAKLLVEIKDEEENEKQKEFDSHTPYGVCPKCHRNSLIPVSDVQGGGYSVLKGTFGAILGTIFLPIAGTVIGLMAGKNKNKTKTIYVCSHCGYRISYYKRSGVKAKKR